VARIRTIKPEYFRHELLQDLEAEHPELHPMLVFAGLWGQCDKNGVFEYRPRQLKLDILPFLDYDMGASLVLLREAKLISLMLHGEKIYGFVPTFKEHQRINGKEAQDSSKFPQPSEMIDYLEREATGKQRGSTGEVTETTGREGKGIGKEERTLSASFDAEQSDEPEFYLTAKKRKLTGERLSTFNEFMDAFGDRRGKAQAADSWYDLKPFTRSLFAEIMAGAKRYNESRDKMKQENRTPKMAQGWLTGRRWEDEAPGDSAKNVFSPVTQQEAERLRKAMAKYDD